MVDEVAKRLAVVVVALLAERLLLTPEIGNKIFLSIDIQKRWK